MRRMPGAPNLDVWTVDTESLSSFRFATVESTLHQMSPPDTSDWKLCALPNCREINRRSLPTDRNRVRAWLMSLRGDSAKLSAMRAVLSPRGRHRGSMRDDSLVDWLTNLAASGEVHLHSTVPPIFPLLGGPSGAEPDPVPFPLSERKARPTTDTFRAPAFDDPPTFPSGVNLAQQGAALMEAAAQGAPLCPI